ncbi:MAG: hypothetical protein ACD_28C00160G0002 [uncultured bacterium]|nr:MAG: hypothetical protein ACD_28C00160G0002 [uncultured bacterium]KKT75035.1 MAG: hypothetical protein UW70_C0040G0010 [Candidatus Peregrinibacteria bacterium GW2011_GWA2_44_7]
METIPTGPRVEKDRRLPGFNKDKPLSTYNSEFGDLIPDTEQYRDGFFRFTNNDQSVRVEINTAGVVAKINYR